MGKPTAEPPSNSTSITHFSHPHPLDLFNPQTSGQILHCSACKLSASAAPAVYACVGCAFFLHPKCSQLPQQISHPFDEKHGLTLYPQPVYPEGLFNCDGCGHRGSGFSYHCSPCGVDLHTTCANLPIKLTHRLHLHPLTLTFSAPYAGNSFSCDICKKLGSKTWLYSCAACEFDVHLTCVATVVPPAAPPPLQQPLARSFVQTNQPMMPNYQNNPPPNAGAFAPPPQVVGSGYPVGMPAPPPVVGSGYPVGMAPPQQQPQAYGHAVRPAYGRGAPATPLKNQMAVAAVEGITGGIAQSATTALFQGLFGGGGGGGGGGVVLEGSAGYEQGAYFDEGGGAAAEEGYSGGDDCYNYN